MFWIVYYVPGIVLDTKNVLIFSVFKLITFKMVLNFLANETTWISHFYQYFQWQICFSPLLQNLKLGTIIICSVHSMSLALCSSLRIQKKLASVLLTETLIILSCILITIKFDLDFLDSNCFNTGQLGNVLDIFLTWLLLKSQSVLLLVKTSDIPAKFLTQLASTMPNTQKSVPYLCRDTQN